MTNKLQEYFPMIQTRESIMEQIEADRHLKSMFEQWGENHRQEFLDFCTGVRDRKITRLNSSHQAKTHMPTNS